MIGFDFFNLKIFEKFSNSFKEKFWHRTNPTYQKDWFWSCRPTNMSPANVWFGSFSTWFMLYCCWMGHQRFVCGRSTLYDFLISAENQLSSILQKVSIPIHDENACNSLVGWKESIIRSGITLCPYMCVFVGPPWNHPKDALGHLG